VLMHVRANRPHRVLFLSLGLGGLENQRDTMWQAEALRCMLGLLGFV
jgi:hypothetical protein